MVNDKNSKLELIVAGREKDLGGFSVRRILPYLSHRMVGPFIFFDHMGPATTKPGKGMTVRPHPHINLATVTYLFSGAIQHKDSLGSDTMIEPGAINWMTAGKGIVHSERTPPHLVNEEVHMNGIQLWVALPTEFEEIDPSFSHHPRDSLPSFNVGDVKMKILLGTAFGQKSPVPVHSDMFYIEVHLKKGQRFTLPSEGREIAVYNVDGKISVDGSEIDAYSMAIAKENVDLEIVGIEDTRVMLLGGKPLGKRYIYWNFVSSSEGRLEEAKADWKTGPRKESQRFRLIPNDDKEFIPLPEEKGNPKGTPL